MSKSFERFVHYYLYNPHGSDATELEKLKERRERNLYNPHGSDVTKNCIKVFVHANNFITHTVQMEPHINLDELIHQYGFISHTVQMEPYPYRQFEKKKLYFITHTVQMERVVVIESSIAPWGTL